METPTDTAQAYKRAPALAAALLFADLKYILLLYPMLVMPGLLLLYRQDNSQISIIASLVCERILQLVFFAVLGTRAINSISRIQRSINIPLIINMVVIGGLIWLSVNLPLLVMLFSKDQRFGIVALFIVVPGAAFAYRGYLYCLALLLGRRSLRQALGFSRQIINQARTLPMRVEFVGTTLLALCVGLVTSPAPDGHLVLVDFLAKGVSGVSWVVTSYLAIAYGLMQLNSAAWQEFGLEPYREGRIETLSLRAPRWLGAILSPRRALSLLGVAILLLGLNQVRASQTPPRASFTFGVPELEQELVRIKLQAEDSDFHFRGFRPELFRLAGESGVIIAERPSQIIVNGKKLEATDPLPVNQSRIEIVIEFKADRTPEQLRQLKDLYLWYNRARIESIKWP